MNFLTNTFFRRSLLVLLPFTAIVVYGYSKLITESMKAAENRTVQEYLRSEFALFERRVCDRMGWEFTAGPQGKEFIAQVTLES